MLSQHILEHFRIAQHEGCNFLEVLRFCARLGSILLVKVSHLLSIVTVHHAPHVTMRVLALINSCNERVYLSQVNLVFVDKSPEQL